MPENPNVPQLARVSCLFYEGFNWKLLHENFSDPCSFFYLEHSHQEIFVKI